MYQALYRKYRPKSFSDVVGQEHITETLRRQIETGRTSHAYLFVGTRGTGKTTCAKILSRALNCEHPVNGDPCNECAACRGIESGAVMDVVEIDAASNNGVDNIRAIRDEAVYTPASVKKRVYIVDEVHMLSTSAFNALLKILEEPPEHLVFILATTELRKVPPTILSRCQRFSFKRLTPENIRKRLKFIASQEGFELTDGAASLLSRLADGAMRDALSLLDQCRGGDKVDENAVMSAVGLTGSLNTAALWEKLRGGDIPGTLELFEKLYYGGADPGTVVSDLLSLCRDMMMIKVAPQGSGQLLSGAFGADRLAALSSGLSAGRLLAVSDTLQETITSMNTVKDRKTAAELCLIKLAGMISGNPLEEEHAPRFEVKPLIRRPAAAPGPQKTSAPAPWEDLPAQAVESAMGTPALSDADMAPPPWDEEPPEDTINWAQPEEKAPEPAAPDRNEDAWWDDTLKICSTHVEETRFRFLSDKVNLAPELTGNSLIMHAANDFVLLMVNDPAVKSAVSQAASTVLGRNITVDTSVGIVRKEVQDDKLDSLARFGNIKFE
ncbi:MAG: DNA polymerase III subunit gamma/tau [Oscillospiraceae bacterium]